MGRLVGFMEGMEEMLAKGAEDGEFKKDWDYSEFGTKAYAMIEGGIFN